MVRRKSSMRKRIIAIVGSREIKADTPRRVYEILDRYFEAMDEGERARALIVSGGARGIDSIADSYAESRNIPFVVVNADWQRYGRGAGFLRNQVLALADEVIAFRTHEGSKGTDHTLELAGSRRRKLTVIDLHS